MSLITPELLVIVLILTACCLLFSFFNTRKLKHQPILRDEAVVQNKDYRPNRLDSLFSIDFLIVAQNTVITCKAPFEVWERLENGQRGVLTHKGGFLQSFECNGAVYSAVYSSGTPV